MQSECSLSSQGPSSSMIMTSKKPERPHPLDMPEIITLIGYCLPRWKYNDRLGFHDFTPKFLLRCTLVNKTWRDALLPVIWFVYDGFVMRSIPKQVIVKNSQFFRVFFHDRSFSGPFLCRHLRALSISWWDPTVLGELMESNAASLENLIWKGPRSGPSSSLTSSLPMAMTEQEHGWLMRMSGTLDDLQLSHWKLSGRRIVEFLSRCKKLKSLVLTAVEWTDPATIPLLPGSAMSTLNHTSFLQGGTASSPSFSSSSYSSPASSPSPSSYSSSPSPSYSASSCPSSSFNTANDLYNSLGHSHSHSQSHTSALQELRLDISQPKENAFVDLIQSSPNLTTFSLLTESASDPRSLMPLIRLFCPKLRSIELMLRFSSSLQGFDYLTETEYADLILAAPPHQLETLKVDIPWLDDGMTQAIIQHQAMSLTSLHLKFKARRSMDPMKDPENIVKILKWCTRLRHVSISFNPHGLGREETIRLVDQPWGCLDLETLELIDVTMTDSMVLGHAQALNDLQQHQHQQQQSYQWHLASTTDSDNNYNQGGGPVMAGGGGFGIGGVAVSSATHPGGGSGGARESRHGMSAKQMLFEQVRRLPRLTKLSLNHVTYSINGQS